MEQAALSPDEFYAQLYKLINPEGLNAKQAYEATLTALVEQLETRVKSVENGEAYFHKGGSAIAMPNGAAIFETVGPWEDFATPSRDMRLLIAMNVLLKFPEKILSYPELFNLTAESAKQVKSEIEQLHEKMITEKTIQYIRSNGEPWKLSVADILARKSAFEMGYNPNDCVEVRWGAEVRNRGIRQLPPTRTGRADQTNDCGARMVSGSKTSAALSQAGRYDPRGKQSKNHHGQRQDNDTFFMLPYRLVFGIALILVILNPISTST